MCHDARAQRDAEACIEWRVARAMKSPTGDKLETNMHNEPIDLVGFDYSLGDRRAEQALLPLTQERKIGVKASSRSNEAGPSTASAPRPHPRSVTASILRATTAGENVVWQAQAIDLRGVTAAMLSFESWRSGARARVVVEVSRDGATRVAMQVVPPFDQWTTIEIDLRAFAGAVSRCASCSRPARGWTLTESGLWRMRHVRLVREPGR